VLALVCVQIGLFIWMAWRGLDLTDESYYLLSYQYWRGFTATATFFGAYFDLPFRLLGGDVGAMRVFGMALLTAAGGVFAWRAFLFGRDAAEPVPWPFIGGGMAGAFFYYSYATTLRAPSYNLLVLFCMLTASALLLMLAEGRGSRRRLAWVAFGYGAIVGVCALTKATSAIAMVACHLIFLTRFATAARLLEWVVCALAGVAVNLLALQIAQPHWIDVLREGIQLTISMDGRYAAIPFAVLWDAVVRGAVRLLPALVLAALVFVVVVRRWGRAHRAVLSSLVVLLVAGILFTIQWQGYGKSWWVLLLFGTTLLWLAERLCRETPLPRWRDVRGVAALSALLFALPICYSIGTNGSLPAHTQMATVFGVVALMLPLRRLHSLGLIHGSALAGALALLCVPMLVSQLRSLDDPAFTYLLRSGLLDQQYPMALGLDRNTLRLDSTTRDNLDALTQQMAAAGYRRGEPVLDATGDGPGLVYALGGRPLGVAWMVGGYPGSERVAARVIDGLPVAELRGAWMLSADDNPRALRSLPQRLSERTGEPGPRPAGSVRLVARYRGDNLPPELVTLTLWKPSAHSAIDPKPALK